MMRLIQTREAYILIGRERKRERGRERERGRGEDEEEGRSYLCVRGRYRKKVMGKPGTPCWDDL